MYKIETDKPMPQVSGKVKYPLDEMNVGDSFFVPLTDVASYRSPLASRISYSCKKLGIKASVRQEGDGYRVWRVK